MNEKRRNFGISLAICQVAFAVVVALLLFSADSTIVSGFDLEELTKGADLIVIGQVISVTERGPTAVPLGPHNVSAHLMTGEVRMDRILKGSYSSSSLIFQFVKTEEYIGWLAPDINSYRVFFLKGSSGEFELANPYLPSVPAIRGTFDAGTGSTVLERVVRQVAAVLISAA